MKKYDELDANDDIADFIEFISKCIPSILLHISEESLFKSSIISVL